MLLKQCQDGDSCEIFNNNSLNCFNYHDKGVKRRFPYSLSQTGQYTLLYIDEMCKKKCMKDDCPFAHNIQEQTYHPMKIKKEACKDRQYCRFNLYHQVDDQKEQQKQYDKICQNYCYNYHRPDEQEYYNQLRKKLQNQYEKMKEELLKNQFVVQGVGNDSIRKDMNQTQNTTLLDFTGFVNEELNIDQQDTLDQNFRSNLADTSISQIYQKSPFGITTINEKQDQIFNNNDLLEETDDEMSSNQIQKKEVEQIKNKNKSNTSKNQQSNNTKSKKNNNIVSNSSKQIEEEKSEKKSKKERQYSPILKDIQINEDKPNQHQIKFSQQENNKQEDVKDYNYFKRKILKYEYLYNAQFDENEGLFLEFKDYYFSNKDDNNGNKNQDIVINKTIRTILSFLNSYGGFIVFGINDEKYVKGSNMNMDQFANSITPLLVKCQPSVNDKHYMFHEINLKDNSKKKIMVIQVYPQNYKIFLNQNDNYFRRTNASVISYETSDFVDIVKSNYKSKYNVKFEQIKIKLEEQRKKKIQEEKQKIRDQQKKDYINLLEFIKKQTDINKIIGAIDFKLSELQNE